jgi:hypothetical protein
MSESTIASWAFVTSPKNEASSGVLPSASSANAGTIRSLCRPQNCLCYEPLHTFLRTLGQKSKSSSNHSYSEGLFLSSSMHPILKVEETFGVGQQCCFDQGHRHFAEPLGDRHLAFTQSYLHLSNSSFNGSFFRRSEKKSATHLTRQTWTTQEHFWDFFGSSPFT